MSTPPDPPGPGPARLDFSVLAGVPETLNTSAHKSVAGPLTPYRFTDYQRPSSCPHNSKLPPTQMSSNARLRGGNFTT